MAAHLPKLLENRRLFRWRNADSRVAHRDLRTIVYLVGSDGDSPSLGRELHRVGQKIEKNLFDLALIADILPEPIVHIDIQGNAVLDGTLAHKCPGVVNR